MIPLWFYLVLALKSSADMESLLGFEPSVVAKQNPVFIHMNFHISSSPSFQLHIFGSVLPI